MNFSNYWFQFKDYFLAGPNQGSLCMVMSKTRCTLNWNWWSDWFNNTRWMRNSKTNTRYTLYWTLNLMSEKLFMPCIRKQFWSFREIPCIEKKEPISLYWGKHGFATLTTKLRFVHFNPSLEVGLKQYWVRLIKHILFTCKLNLYIATWSFHHWTPFPYA